MSRSSARSPPPTFNPSTPAPAAATTGRRAVTIGDAQKPRPPQPENAAGSPALPCGEPRPGRINTGQLLLSRGSVSLRGPWTRRATRRPRGRAPPRARPRWLLLGRPRGTARLAPSAPQPGVVGEPWEPCRNGSPDHEGKAGVLERARPVLALSRRQRGGRGSVQAAEELVRGQLPPTVDKIF